jgi:iron complex outermembrane receptor protein
MYEAGGVSRLPAIHGMADERLRILAGGVNVTAACANHMNPPLTYSSASMVDKVEVYSGVVPVSKGGDSIGGTIIAEPRSPVFRAAAPRAPAPGVIGAPTLPLGPGADRDAVFSGEASSFFRSNNRGIGVSALVNAAADHYALLYNGSWSRATDYRAGGDGAKVLSTNFITENHQATLAYQNEGRLLSLRGAYSNIPYQGFVNQRMDMTANRSYQIEGKFQGGVDWGFLDARVYWHTVAHKMGFLGDKQVDNMPMATDGLDYGYSARLDHSLDAQNLLHLGSEFHGFRLNDWWEPIPGGGVMAARDNTTFMGASPLVYDMVMRMMTPNTQWNIRDGVRNRLGHYAEWEAKWTPQWSTLLGVRNDIVMSNAGQAAAYDPNYKAIMPMQLNGFWLPGVMLNPDALAAQIFNARDRRRTDVNFDMTAQVKYAPDPGTLYEAGYSRKTRSPNLYERYSWGVGTMTSAMINQFGDANGYVGNLGLKPEVAHTFAITGAWRDANKAWEARVSPYYSYVENYIDANRVGSFAFTGPALPGPYMFQELQFRNHKAMIWGVDASARAKLLDDPVVGKVHGNVVASYTYGRNLDTGDPRACGATTYANPLTLAAFAANQNCYLAAEAARKGDALYNIMPITARLWLEHQLGGWSNAIELNVVGAKTHVSVQRNELWTPAYALLSFRSSYAWDNFRIDFAVENLADTLYYPALGGFYYTGYKVWTNTGLTSFPLPSPVPGMGRNFIAGLTVKF